MRFGFWLAAGCFAMLAGCGYVGPVLPPSPLLPQAITDLSVVERGDQIVITFSTPPRTTDNLPVKEFSKIDLRVGSAVRPFDFDRWAASASSYELEPPDMEATDPDNPVPIAMTKTLPAASWTGQRIAIAVRTAVRKKDHFSAWSNRAVLEVHAPLQPPAVEAKPTAKGVLLTWQPEADASTYRVYRKTAGDQQPAALLGSSTSGEFLDTNSQYGTPYEYTVIAARENAESLASQPVPITTRDIFPPSVPTGLTVLAAPNSIELSWQRSPEADLKGYYIFRASDSGSYEQVGGLVTLPSFSDRAVAHGNTYRYAVSAVDQSGNASERSAPVEARY